MQATRSAAVATVVRALPAALGVAFGFVLSRSGAADYDFVQGLFLLENLHLLGVIAAAMAVIAPGLAWLERRGRTAFDEPLRTGRKPAHPGNVLGGLLFGAGWSLTGMCPGPIYVALGEGKLYALGALAGALAGAALFARVRDRLARPLRLPDGPRPAETARAVPLGSSSR